jgi:N-acetylglucosamine kinase-like BadF-type ATPase
MITLGIDGGGTKTRCVAVNEEGEVLATTTVGSTNINAIEHGTVRERLAEAVVTVLSQASAEPADVVAVGLGMSGVGRPADVQLVRRWMAEICRTPTPTSITTRWRRWRAAPAATSTAW